MRVFMLGGAGLVGQEAAAYFASNNAISEIMIAGRNPEKAAFAASNVGKKANSVKADVMDEKQIARLVADYDIFLNTSGPDYMVQHHAVSAAISAGVDYCDVSCDGPTAERVLKMNEKAKDAGISAIIGIGWMPGLTNLMMKHAALQLDKTETIYACLLWPMADLVKSDTKKIADELRSAGPYSASWETAMRGYSGECRVYRNKNWTTIDPSENGMTVAHPEGGSVMMYPACSAEPVTVPHYLHDVRNVTFLISFSPFPLNELALQLASRIRKGDINTKDAALSFIETAGSEPRRWLTCDSDRDLEMSVWIDALGIKDGARTRYRLVQDTEWGSTGGPLYTAAMKLLDGGVREPGILPPEACLDPVSFMTEVASLVSGRPTEKSLFRESLERLA
jgi:hypothetical protein